MGAHLESIATRLDTFPGECVGSLSEAGDLLSQWRAYGGGPGSFALGLCPDHLRKVAHEQQCYLVKCIYSPVEQRKVVGDLILEFYERLASAEMAHEPDIPGMALDTCIGSCAAGASRLAMSLKHESFQEEQEWRLISQPKPIKELEFRPGVSTRVPYFSFDLGSDREAYLNYIVVGPTPHPELVLRPLEKGI